MKLVRSSFRAMTLIEVLISVTLTMMLLAVLLQAFVDVTGLRGRIFGMRQEAMELRYLQHRLGQLFTHALHSSDGKGKGVIFYSKESDSPRVLGQSLIFSYDNGAVLSPEFSNAQLGRLYLDTEGRLCLASWPLPLEQWEGQLPPMYHEVLMEGVEVLSFSFFYPQDLEENRESGPMDTIQTSWSFEWKEKPVLLTVFLQTQGRRTRPLHLSFSLFNDQKPLVLKDL